MALKKAPHNNVELFYISNRLNSQFWHSLFLLFACKIHSSFCCALTYLTNVLQSNMSIYFNNIDGNGYEGENYGRNKILQP